MTNTKKTFLSVNCEFKDFEQKQEDQGVFGYFSGYAATFGNLDRTGDIIEKGAFTKTLSARERIKMYWQHDSGVPIGSFFNMVEDDKGLDVTGRINLGTEKGRDAYALLKAGDIKHLSIGYVPVSSSYSPKGETRFLKQIDLYEISVVSEPANLMAEITDVKNLLANALTLVDIEAILKAKGFTGKESKTLISKIKSVHPLRDVEDTANEEDMDGPSRDDKQNPITQQVDALFDSIQSSIQQLKQR
ncbi:MAG: hypothetical protein A2Y53_05710 [Chloroflexi bacterium RBG_16_47_49]|nr:MAG: hypothetical protein A2Y53_05710 [Chloroflexi bacterium RBG_16_47_49]